MKLSFRLAETNQQIQNNILNALLPEIRNYFNTAISKFKTQVPTILQQAIFASPEYNSLISGKLKFEFGIPDAVNKINAIINIWINNIEYSYQQPIIQNQNIRAQFSAGLIRSDYSDVLGTDYANVIDVSGYSLPWLQWLLLDGRRIIVPNHQVILGPSKSSRTGFAIMRKSSNSWNVPAEFAGTSDDNWITRAIDSAEPEIQQLLDRVL